MLLRFPREPVGGKKPAPIAQRLHHPFSGVPEEMALP